MEYLLKMVEATMEELEKEKAEFEKVKDDFEVTYHRGQLHSLSNIRAYAKGNLNMKAYYGDVRLRILDLMKWQGAFLLTEDPEEEDILGELEDAVNKVIDYYSLIEVN